MSSVPVASSAAPPLPPAQAPDGRDPLADYLDECRELVLDEIRAIVPEDGRHTGGLYELMLDYPLRGGKALRPALGIATCRLLGGTLASVIRSAAVLELYHNAFLIHDDVEDGSEKRRAEETLHRMHGVPVAVNVGDGMLALTLAPLLDNMRLLGMGRALRVLEAISEMARESAEGQMLELDWIRRRDWTPSDRDYMRMVHKKSGFYTFVTPVRVGAIVAGATDERLRALSRFATAIGIAFQIQDDVLNLVAEEGAYGKEIGGDLYEGKHTLILIHAMRSASASDRARGLRILARPRASTTGPSPRDARAARERIRALVASGAITERDARLLRRGVGRSHACKTEGDVAFLRELIDRHGSIDYAWAIARRWADRAVRSLRPLVSAVPDSVHCRFLSGLADYVVHRDR